MKMKKINNKRRNRRSRTRRIRRIKTTGTIVISRMLTKMKTNKPVTDISRHEVTSESSTVFFSGELVRARGFTMLGVESESLRLKLSDPERKKRAPRKTARLTDGKTGKEALSHDLGPQIGEVSGNGTPAISGQMQGW